MVLLDRVFLGIIAVILVCFAGLLLATILGSSFAIEWLVSSSLPIDGGILAVIFLLLAVYLLILIFKGGKGRFIVYPRELGAVRISVDSVESLIVEAAKQLPGLEQVKATITEVEEPKVVLNVQVHPDHNIPQLSEELQENVKKYVESTAGVLIKEIEVRVVGISKRNETDLDAIA